MRGRPQDPGDTEDLMEAAPCGFLRFRDDGTVVRVNAALCAMVGYRRDEIENQHLSTILTRGAAVFYETHFFPLLRLHGKVEEIYLSVRHQDGTMLPVLVNAVRQARPDALDEGLGANDCVFIRMSQRSRYEEEILVQKKAAEKAIKLKDEALAVLVETGKALHARTTELEALMREVPVAIFMGHGVDCAEISGNPAAHRLLGMPEPSTVLGPVENLVFHFRREGRPLTWGELPMQRAAAAGRAIPSEEWDLISSDGTTRRILGSAVPLKGKDGTLTGSLGTFSDITERKQIEIALEESAALFSSLVEQAPTGMYVVDADFRMKQINKRAAPVFGSISPLLGRDLAEVMEILWGPEVGGECTRIFRHTLETGERYLSPSFENVRFDLGARQAFEWETQRVTLPDGQFGVVCYFQEVTDRVRADRALRESEERMHLATEATAVGIWEWHLPTDDVRWDPQMFRIYGIEPTAEGAVTSLRAQNAMVPEDRPTQEEKIRELLQRGGKGNREFRIIRQSDGAVRHIEAVEVVRHNADGQAQWMVGTNLDVTERMMAAEAIRESEERFRTLADNIPQLTWMADGNGIVFWHNERWFDYTGATPGEAFDVGWIAWVHPEHCERVGARWERERLDSHIWEDTFPLRGADGDYRWYLSRAIPIRDAAGKVQRWFGTNTDITDQRRAADDLAQAKEETEAASRAKDDFLAALSHELRTPLTPALMTASILENDPTLPPAIRLDVGMMRRNIELEAALIDDLLDLTKISRGKMTLARAVTNIHDLLGHAIEIQRSDYQRKGIALHLHLEAGRSHADVDPIRLQQVFWNLLKNAVKFTPEEGTIRVTTRNDGEKNLVVEVNDSGIGIASEAISDLFKPFEQGEVAGQHRYGGLGLGLAISHAIIDAHGGHLVVASEGRGCGATFTATFESVDAPTDTPQGPETDPQPLTAGSLRMLIVEDHESTRRVLAKLMGDAGHAVTTASTLKEAREAFGKDPFDLVISDLGLPDGSGLDLMREFQSQHPVPAIALSGYGMEEDTRRIKEAGFSANLVKPIRMEALLKLIAEVTRDGEVDPSPGEA